MNTNPIRAGIHKILLVFLCLVATAAVQADVYDFEIVVFERPDGGANEFWPSEPGEPDPSIAKGRLNSSGASGGATLLPASAKALGPSAYTLKKKGMIVHDHLAWRQETHGRNSNTWYWIGGGRLSGLIRMSQGRYLHLDTDLILRDAVSSQPYRIKLHRRMRSDELHYVDHPRLGILIRAERYRTAAPVDDGAADEGEPKPASPPPTDKPS